MRRRGMLVILIFVLSIYSGSVYGGFEGNSNTFYGTEAGVKTTGDNDGVTFIGAAAGYNNTAPYNTFIGRSAGYSNADGQYNTFVGYGAGYSNTTAYSNSFFGYHAGYSTTQGDFNTFIGFSAGYKSTGSNNIFVGYSAGYEHTSGDDNTYLGSWAGYNNTTGYGNVFLGEYAGYNETGSNKLYVGSSYYGPPLIYGEFDNDLLRINGSGHFSGLGVPRSQLHFSLGNTDTGGWITSVLDNNFWLSSGAMYDQNAGGWIQKSPDGKAIMAGSGGVGYRLFTTSGNTAGNPIASQNLITRLHIDYSGHVAFNTPVDPAVAIDTGTGAYLSLGGVWTSNSSRKAKDDIKDLGTGEALETLSGLKPVKFAYKADREERHVGFIAEDVPELVATKDRKGLSPMDIVAVLTKVVQEQQKTMQEQRDAISTLSKELKELRNELGK